MSWKLTKEVREARFAGLLKNLTPTQFFVLFIMADTCRSESRVARISIQELQTLTGHKDRTAISLALQTLITDEYIKRVTIGNQYQSASYEILTFACCADATPNGDEHVGNSAEHVGNSGEHVGNSGGACCADATHPESDGTIPINNPEGERASAPRSPSSDLVVDANDPPIIVDAEVIPIQQTNNPYAHLGFMPSAVERSIDGIIPPSRFCRDHHPNHPGKNCVHCGHARIYRDNEWPITENGLRYTSGKAMAIRMAERKGRHDAPAAETALQTNSTIPQRNQRVLDLLAGAASRAGITDKETPALNGHSVDDHNRFAELYGRGLLTAEAISVQEKMDKVEARDQLPVLVRDELREAGIGTSRRQNGHREPRPLDVDCPTCRAPKGSACRAPGTRRLVSPPHPAREEAAQRWARIA